MIPKLRKDLLIISLLVLVLAQIISGCQPATVTPPTQTKAVSIQPTAQKLIQEGQYEAALALYNQQVKSGNNLAEAYAERGSYYTITKHFDKAIADYTASLKINKSVNVLIARCNAYHLLSEFDAAIADCTQAAQLDPTQADAQIVLASIYIDQSQLDKARIEIQKAIETDPKSAKAEYVLSQIEINSQNLDKAVEALTKAIQVDPKNVAYYWQRGFLYISLGKVDEAKADMRAILKYGNPNTDGDLLLKAGSELRAMGENP